MWVGVVGQGVEHLHEGPHDLHVRLHGHAIAQHAREHGHALLCTDVGQVRADDCGIGILTC